MIGGFRSVLCVSVLQGSLLVIVIVIDGSKKSNCEGRFRTLESHVCEKRSKARKDKSSMDSMFCYLYWQTLSPFLGIPHFLHLLNEESFFFKPDKSPSQGF